MSAPTARRRAGVFSGRVVVFRKKGVDVEYARSLRAVVADLDRVTSQLADLIRKVNHEVVDYDESPNERKHRLSVGHLCPFCIERGLSVEKQPAQLGDQDIDGVVHDDPPSSVGDAPKVGAAGAGHTPAAPRPEAAS